MAPTRNCHYALQAGPLQTLRNLLVHVVSRHKTWEGRPETSSLRKIIAGNYLMLQWYDSWVVVCVAEVVHTKKPLAEFERNGHEQYVPGTTSPQEALDYYAKLYPSLDLATTPFCFFKIFPVEFKFGQTLLCGGCGKVVGTKPAADRKTQWATCGHCSAYLCGDCRRAEGCNFCQQGTTAFKKNNLVADC